MKTVVVTGASGNLGQAVVKKFLEEGYRVVGTIVPHDRVEIHITHPHFEKVVVDLTSEEDTQKFLADTEAKYAVIDAVVATVGGFATGGIAETSTSDLSRQYKLNFETAYNIARPAFKHMVEKQAGRIFLIGSRPGMSAANGKGMVAYGLAKSLIFRLAELMNDEAKGLNVVVSVIVPSTIDTEPNRSSMPTADFSKWVKATSIADIIYFYCSDAGATLREPVIKIFNNS